MIWIEAIVMVPVCVLGIYAFWKGKNWFQVPGIIYASILIYSVCVILVEQIFGLHAAPNLPGSQAQPLSSLNTTNSIWMQFYWGHIYRFSLFLVCCSSDFGLRLFLESNKINRLNSGSRNVRSRDWRVSTDFWIVSINIQNIWGF